MREGNYQRRAKEITEQLTLDEKVRLCTGYTYWSTFPLKRFGISECVMSDGPHGVRKVKEKDHLGQAVNEKATAFPVSAAMGATWNTGLMYQVGAAMGRECQKIGVDLLLGPAVNMKRSVLGGRNFEYLSEDPVLAGRLGAELVKGIQSTGTGACVKHFACNNSETQRMTADVQVDERTLRELYLKVFEIIIKEGRPAAVMGAYNKINGEYACEKRELLTDILREEWGFDGIVLSDWLAVEDCVKAVAAGLNLEMPSNPLVYEKLKAAVADGRLKEETLNTRVEELLSVLLKLQEQRNPREISWKEHGEIARKTAVESMVLLKNEHQLLPFDMESIKSMAVIGDFAVHPRTQGGGSSRVETGEEENILTALERLSGGKTRFVFARGYEESGESNEQLRKEAAEAAGSCDAAVIFAGLPASYESEGYDRESLELPDGHIQLIQEIARRRKDVLVVLSNGAPIRLPFAKDVDGILETWLLGQEAPEAIAEVILNMEQPSGRLPETFPEALDKDPVGYRFLPDEGCLFYGERMMTGYRYYEKQGLTPAWPFGYGLSYTSFSYQGLRAEKEEGEWKVSVAVKNTGKLGGYEVVQLYVSNLSGKMLHPVKELKAFEKIYLDPGQEKEVCFLLGKEAFQCYSSRRKGWMTEEGTYEIAVGSSSADIRERLRIFMEKEPEAVPDLTWTSTLEEWLDHPAGRREAEGMLLGYKGFGMGSQGKKFEDLSHFVQRIMLEMPMPRLITASQDSFTEEELEAMLNRTKEREVGEQ